jgi:hypothetical protein
MTSLAAAEKASCLAGIVGRVVSSEVQTDDYPNGLLIRFAVNNSTAAQKGTPCDDVIKH